jgi:hypothetical protein
VKFSSPSWPAAGGSPFQDDRLSFKVDDLNRPAYRAIGMDCFKPLESRKEMHSNYQVPEDILAEPLLLLQRALAAIKAARCAKRGDPGSRHDLIKGRIYSRFISRINSLAYLP